MLEVWKGGEIADCGHRCVCSSWLEHDVVSFFWKFCLLSASRIKDSKENLVTKYEACEVEFVS